MQTTLPLLSVLCLFRYVAKPFMYKYVVWKTQVSAFIHVSYFRNSFAIVFQCVAIKKSIKTNRCKCFYFIFWGILFYTST